jgi:hypothetical protein
VAMKQQPKAAVPVLESGVVRTWFETNGWTYPVAGPEVKGVAAVQQFFEAMGLSKPPVVGVSPAEVRLRCKYPDSARYELTLSTPAKKWVYATIASDSPWVHIPSPQVSGPQKTSFLIEIDSSRMTTVGAHGEAKVKVLANGGKTIEVRVVADVSGMPAVRPAPAPAVPAAPAASARSGVPPVAAQAPSYAADGVAATPRRGEPSRAARARSSVVASLLILPLLFLIVRLAMVPISDGLLRSAAVRSAAQKLNVNVTADSPVGGWAGWLRLPWPAIMAGSNVRIPNELFDPDNHKTEAASELRDNFVGSFVRTLVFLTWWLGGVLGAVLLWRRGGAFDVPWGFVAGAVGGLAAAATFGSAFLVIEMIPQFIWHVVSGDSGGPVAWVFWVLLATLSWLALGTGLGIVCAALPPLRRLVLLPLQRLPAALLRMAGMPTMAAFWWAPPA